MSCILLLCAAAADVQHRDGPQVIHRQHDVLTCGSLRHRVVDQWPALKVVQLHQLSMAGQVSLHGR